MQEQTAPPDGPAARGLALPPVTRRQRLNVALNAAVGASFFVLIYHSLWFMEGGQFWPILPTAALMTLLDHRLIGPLLDRLRGQGEGGPAQPRERGRDALIHILLITLAVTVLTEIFESLVGSAHGAAFAVGLFAATFLVVGTITFVWSMAAKLRWRWAAPLAGGALATFLGLMVGAVMALSVPWGQLPTVVRLFGPFVMVVTFGAVWGLPAFVGGVAVARGRLTFVALVLPMLACPLLTWLPSIVLVGVSTAFWQQMLPTMCMQGGWALGVVACRDSARVFAANGGR